MCYHIGLIQYLVDIIFLDTPRDVVQSMIYHFETLTLKSKKYFLQSFAEQ